MSLPAVIAAVVAALEVLPDITVSSNPPKSLPSERFIAVYERPGTSTPIMHHPLTVESIDTVFVEFHHQMAVDVDPAVVLDVRETFETVKLTLYGAWSHGRFDKTVKQMQDTRSEFFGPMEYGEAITFGFRLAVQLTHTDVIP